MLATRCLVVFAWAVIGLPVLAASSATVVPFDIQDNRILIDVKINAKGPYRMMVDTGASFFTLNTAAAKALGLKLHDPFNVNVAGAQPVVAYRTEVDALQIGDISIPGQAGVAVPMDDMIKAIGFPKLDGIIGADFFLDHVVEVNFSRRQLTLRSASYVYNGPGETIPLSLDGTVASMPLKMDGASGQFWIDTGDRFTLSMFDPFLKRTGLRAKYPDAKNVVTGQGLGGVIHSDVARIQSIQVGSDSSSGVPIRFLNPDDLSDPVIAGNIGTGLLKTYNVIFDYPRKRLVVLGKSGLTDTEFDRSGLWMVGGDNAFVVTSLVAGGPAEKAGLQLGDRILSIDDVLVNQLSLLDERKRLSDDQLSSVSLVIQGNQKTRTVTLPLESYL